MRDKEGPREKREGMERAEAETETVPPLSSLPISKYEPTPAPAYGQYFAYTAGGCLVLRDMYAKFVSVVIDFSFIGVSGIYEGNCEIMCI